MPRAIHPARRSRSPARIAAAITVSVLVLSFAAVYTIGGLYGLVALTFGNNPLALTPPTPAGERETRRRAQIIVDAVEAHIEDHGQPPPTLEALVPDYLPEIPLPTVGERRWRYDGRIDGLWSLDHFIGPIYEHDWYQRGQWHSDR